MRMQRRLWGIWVLSLLLPCVEGAAENRRVYKVDTLAMNSIVQKYSAALAALSHDTTAFPLDTGMRYAPPFFRLLTPGTLYDAPMRQAFSVSWTPALPAKADSVPSLMGEGLKDRGRSVLEEGNRMLMQAYVRVPWLISLTERDLDEAGGLKEEVLPELPEISRLAGNEMDLDLARDVDTVRLVVRRPNFWKFRGDYSFQFTQNYFSENWYQGGTSNVNLLSDQQFSIKYNDPKEQRILFENLVQWRLNINSAPEDTLRSVRVSEDLFQINSKFGLKAYNKWYYTATLNFKTQFLSSYTANTNDKVAAFLSPAELNIGLGMSYQYKNDKKQFETSISLSPLSYNLQFIIDNDMDPSSFGIKSGKSMNQYGSSFEGRIKWEFYHNMVWTCRLFYFTSYDHVQGDWENTFDFILNRFFSTRLFVHLRYDDALALNKDLGHFQLKELLSFGFNYKF